MGTMVGAQARAKLSKDLGNLTRGYIADSTDAPSSWLPDEPSSEESLAALLALAENDPTSYDHALNRFRSQVYAARECVLYPDQTRPGAPSLAKCYRPSPQGFSPNGWRSIISDGGQLALHLYESFLSGPQDAELRRMRANRVLTGLRLMLVARMYSVRADINGLLEMPVIERERSRYQGDQDVLNAFDLAFKQYRTQVRTWKLGKSLRHGELIEGDAAAIDAWSREFGRARDQEYGWNQFARNVGKELRYRRDTLDMRRRWIEVVFRRSPDNAPHSRLGRWRYRLQRFISAVPARLVSLVWALATTAFMIAGFGRKPGRFAANIAVIILVFSGLYFGDDYLLSHCGGMPTLRNYGHALYLAIANFTNVGATVCGPFQGALVSIESLIGFFLLSVLAAMLFVWLTDR